MSGDDAREDDEGAQSSGDIGHYVATNGKRSREDQAASSGDDAAAAAASKARRKGRNGKVAAAVVSIDSPVRRGGGGAVDLASAPAIDITATDSGSDGSGDDSSGAVEGEPTSSDGEEDEEASSSDDEGGSSSDVSSALSDGGEAIEDVQINAARGSPAPGGGGGDADVTAARWAHLEGIRVVDDLDADDAAMAQVHGLLKAQRYHDEEVAAPFQQSLTITRCFRCGLPGHMARECKNKALQKPCSKCAGYGHLSDTCPNGICFRCYQQGHMSRDCPNRTTPPSKLLCVRCGKACCAASGFGDWRRSVYGCSEPYADSDLQHVTCFVCGRKARHCSCKAAPRTQMELTCCLCGGSGHTGLLDDCPRILPDHLQAERSGERHRERQEAQARQQSRYDEGGSGVRQGGGGYRGGKFRNAGQASWMQHDDRGGTRGGGERGGGYERWSQHDDRGTPRYRAEGAAAAARGGGERGYAAAASYASTSGYGPQRYGYEAPQRGYQGRERYAGSAQQQASGGGGGGGGGYAPYSPYAAASYQQQPQQQPAPQRAPVSPAALRHLPPDIPGARSRHPQASYAQASNGQWRQGPQGQAGPAQQRGGWQNDRWR